MKRYHKIPTVYLRDPENNFCTLLEGQFATPELEYLADLDWEWTEMIDGTNIQVMLQDGELHYGGKTDNAQIPARLLDALEALFRSRLNQMQASFQDGCCLYGEGYGARIQKGGGNYRADNGFVLFDVKIGAWWLQRSSVEEIAKELGLDTVPVVGHGPLSSMVERVRTGFNSRWGEFLAEGLVARPTIPLFDRSSKRIITKLKHRDFR